MTGSELIEEEFLWQAVVARDASQDGYFLFGVTSTGVYCRPSCPSRRPRRSNVRFFRTAGDAERAGFRACLRCRPRAAENPRAGLIKSLCDYMGGNLDERLTLEALGRQAGVSPFHLQRLFKRHTGLTPREYADACRLKALKAGLREGRTVTRSMADAGYGSSSRLHARADSKLGMTPSQYRAGGAGARIRYLVSETRLGSLLVASTGRGLCAVKLGDSERGLIEALRKEFPAAELAPGEPLLASWLASILDHLDGKLPELDLPLDVRGTAFEWRVWRHLQSLPYGTTASYGEVAAGIGNPKGARAVARACAANPVALAVPCHRVTCAGGEPGGYRWGVERKKLLLEMERRSGAA